MSTTPWLDTSCLFPFVLTGAITESEHPHRAIDVDEKLLATSSNLLPRPLLFLRFPIFLRVVLDASISGATQYRNPKP